jgi:nitrate reductase gamma subunit
MSMSILLYAIIYASVLIFFVACIFRILQYSRTPIHLRWELYPVPHEEPQRAKHGGSYFETADWWTQPSHYNLWGEYKVLLPEVLFLKSLWEFNRKLWFRSFPFHFGLYLLIMAAALLALGGLLSIFAPVHMTGWFRQSLQLFYKITGISGLLLSMLGALGLLLRRLTDPQLKIYTTPGDIFNLLFFIVAFGVFSAGCLLSTDSNPDMLSLAKGLLTLDTSLKIPGLFAVGLLLIGILVAYIPMTHMSHFIAKYFTYHSVRWDDAVNRRGGTIEAQLAQCLNYRPTWAAAHIQADGKKKWSEVVSTDPAQGEKK